MMVKDENVEDDEDIVSVVVEMGDTRRHWPVEYNVDVEEDDFEYEGIDDE